MELTQILAVPTPGGVELDEDILLAVDDKVVEGGVRHNLD